MSADQRYYASVYGRFNTPDPGRTNVHLGKPGSWNAYAYGNGDPVGNNDPSGRYVDSDSDGTSYCSQFPGDPECAVCLDVPDSPGCIGADDGSDPTTSAPPPSPKCWQNVGNITATLNNLGTDIEKDVAGQFDAAGMQLLTADISTDIASESSSAGGLRGSPNYIGGHFNLNITAEQPSAIFNLDPGAQSAWVSDFGNTAAGVRQTASTGLAQAGGYWLHSQDGENDPGITAGEYSFHFDRFNGNYFPSGTIFHGIYDVSGGHLGHPCLDPAWR